MHLETTEYNKWLGTRLEEIIELKKKNLSDMEIHTGISRRTLKRIIKEGREIKRDEIDLICDFLDISIDRFMGRDADQLIDSIKESMKYHKLEKSLSYAMEYSLMSLGCTEKADAELYLGEILLGLRKMNDAFSHLTKGHNLALKSGIYSLMKKSHKLMLDYYFYNDKFEEMEKFINDVLKTKVCSLLDDYQLGKFYHFLAMSNFYQNKVENSILNFEKAIGKYEISPNATLDIARAKTSIAEIEYQRGNYDNAIELLEWSLDAQKNDNFYNLLITAKDLVRTLIAADRIIEAKKLAHKFLDKVSNDKISVPALVQKLEFAIAYIDKKIDVACDIFQIYNEPDGFKTYIADFIIRHFLEGGDVKREILSECYNAISNEKSVEKFVRGAW